MNKKYTRSNITFFNKNGDQTKSPDDIAEALISISSSDIWSIDIDVALALLTELSNNAFFFKTLKGKLRIAFTDFKYSYKALYSVPQIVQFVKNLFEKWPYFLHFLTSDNDNLKVFLAIINRTEHYDLGNGVTHSVIHAQLPVIIDLMLGPQKLNRTHKVFDEQSYRNELEENIYSFFPVWGYE
jgi:hypothetical protein